MLMGCSSGPFNQMVKNNFSYLFSNSKPNTPKIVRSLKKKKDPILLGECYHS